MLIQTNKILVIFLCLQAKLHLLKILERFCPAHAIENFFWQFFILKKACFFSLAILRCCKSRKKPTEQYRQTEQKELNSVTNMTAKIDIDALKIFEKSRTNEAENQQKIKNSQSYLKIYWL